MIMTATITTTTNQPATTNNNGNSLESGFSTFIAKDFQAFRWGDIEQQQHQPAMVLLVGVFVAIFFFGCISSFAGRHTAWQTVGDIWRILNLSFNTTSRPCGSKGGVVAAIGSQFPKQKFIDYFWLEDRKTTTTTTCAMNNIKTLSNFHDNRKMIINYNNNTTAGSITDNTNETKNLYNKLLYNIVFCCCCHFFCSHLAETIIKYYEWKKEAGRSSIYSKLLSFFQFYLIYGFALNFFQRLLPIFPKICFFFALVRSR